MKNLFWIIEAAEKKEPRNGKGIKSLRQGG
jgi:hypothetical protein